MPMRVGIKSIVIKSLYFTFFDNIKFNFVIFNCFQMSENSTRLTFYTAFNNE